MELIGVNAVEEAGQVCEIVNIIAKQLEDPNARAKHGANLLRAWDTADVAFKGVLGLSRGNEGGSVSVSEDSCLKAAAKAAVCAIDLGQGVNGDTRMSCPVSEVSMEQLTAERKEMEFPTGWGGSFWPAFSDFSESSFPVGACSRITIGLLEAMEIGNNFEDVPVFKNFEEDYELKPMVLLASQGRPGGGLTEVVSSVLSSCDKALASAEYVFKFASGSADVRAVLELVGLRMLVVAEVRQCQVHCAARRKV